MRTHPSWGEGSGVFSGLAEAGRALSWLHIDFEKELKVGVDGVTVQNAIVIGNIVQLVVIADLVRLEDTWKHDYIVYMRIIGLTDKSYQLIMNDVLLGNHSGKELESLNLKITENAKFKIIE
jgi:hypothetical protein